MNRAICQYAVDNINKLVIITRSDCSQSFRLKSVVPTDNRVIRVRCETVDQHIEQRKYYKADDGRSDQQRYIVEIEQGHYLRDERERERQVQSGEYERQVEHGQ